MRNILQHKGHIIRDLYGIISFIRGITVSHQKRGVPHFTKRGGGGISRTTSAVKKIFLPPIHYLEALLMDVVGFPVPNPLHKGRESEQERPLSVPCPIHLNSQVPIHEQGYPKIYISN